MDPSLICMLSYGLMCSPDAEAQAPTPAVEVGAAAAEVEATPPATSDGPKKGTASAILAQVQSFYDGTKDLSATFSQTHVNPVYGTKAHSTGVMKVKKPGMMLWDYKKRQDPDFYVDGKNLSVVERDTRQVLKKSVGNADFAGAEKFLFGGRQLIDDFYVRHASDKLVKRYGMKSHAVVELKPKKKSPHYKRLVLVVDDATGRVDSFVVRNGDDSTNHFKLTKIKTNNGLKSSDFKPKDTKGFVVVKD